MQQVSFVAYIDESGDDGVARVRPIDPIGATEWFVLSAVVVRLKGARETLWVRKILSDLGRRGQRDLHFRDLEDWQKLHACNVMAGLPLRCFVALSNKRNMRGRTNPRAAQFSMAGRTWFYWWMTRLLLERVTDYCERRSLRDYGEPRLVRFEFSRRLGLRYAHFQSYLFWLRIQSRADDLYIKAGDIKWSVVDPIRQVFAYDHFDRAGLQLSDCVASSFYQAVNGNKPEYAQALADRMAFDRSGRVFGYGVKLMPGGYLQRAPAHQRPILDFYVKKRRQAPGS